jgi:catechol 2,3-dioxygenase-like lactoylglutathione lyase family enzyme
LKLFHTGVIVTDLEEAMASYGEAFGLHFAPPKVAATPMRCPAGVLEREARFTYSVEGPHHIELLQQVQPAPYLELTGGPQIHHLGYYTRDLVTETARLEALGFVAELTGVAPDGGLARASYLRNPFQPGMWVELVDDSVAADIDPWMAEAAAQAGVAYTSPFA